MGGVVSDSANGRPKRFMIILHFNTCVKTKRISQKVQKKHPSVMTSHFFVNVEKFDLTMSIHLECAIILREVSQYNDHLRKRIPYLRKFK